MSFTIMPEIAAITLYMNYCLTAIHRLPKMQNQKSLTIHSHSFAGWGRECVAFVFALKGGQYLINECLQSIATDITQDEKLNISDATLTLIL